jgi:hypothetical protein
VPLIDTIVNAAGIRKIERRELKPLIDSILNAAIDRIEEGQLDNNTCPRMYGCPNAAGLELIDVTDGMKRNKKGNGAR